MVEQLSVTRSCAYGTDASDLFQLRLLVCTQVSCVWYTIARASKTSIVKWVSSKPIHVTSREDVMRPNTDHFAMMLCNILMILFTACSNFGLCLLKHHLIAQQNRTSNVATCFTVTINSAPRDSVLRNADLRETMSKQPLYCG